MSEQTFITPDGRRVSARDVANMDAVTETAMDRARDNVESARKGVAALRGASTKWPELTQFADKAGPLIDRADDYELAEEDARASVILRTRERDAASRSALARGEDPQEAERGASDALNAAQADADRFRRYFVQTASLAASEAVRGMRRLAELRKEAAPENLHESLRNLAELRREALEAAETARRKLSAVSSMVFAIRATANDAGEAGGVLAKLAADPHHDPVSRKLNSTDPTYYGALSQLEDWEQRLGFRGSDNPIDLGRDLGAAVRYAIESDDIDSANDTLVRERAEWREREERERGTNARPFSPAPYQG